MQQITINKQIKLSGIGLHSGKIVNLNILPSNENTGIIFKRIDIEDNKKNIIKADYNNVSDTTLCTLLSNSYGVSVGTIEHLMSALSAFFIDNAIIEIDAPEVPILDGSSKLFVNAIKKVGLHYQNASKSVLKILKPVEINSDKWSIKILPNDSLVIDATIDFDNKLIGKQNFLFDFEKNNYEKDLSKARTFTFLKDVKFLQTKGLALGGNLDNAIVVDEDKILNAKGLRYKNEFIRHKILDLIGDIYLSGYYIEGKIIANKMGHQSNNLLIKEIFKSSENYMIKDYGLKYNSNIINQYKHLYN